MTGKPTIDVRALKMGVSLLALLPPDARPKKTGANSWMAFCSFHEDGKKASMSVRLSEQGWVFHCFACQEKGTVVDYVMRTERMSFRDAIARMADGRFATLTPPAPRRSKAVLACDGPGCGYNAPHDFATVEPGAVYTPREDKIRSREMWTVLPDGRTFCGVCASRLVVLPPWPKSMRRLGRMVGKP